MDTALATPEAEIVTQEEASLSARLEFGGLAIGCASCGMFEFCLKRFSGEACDEGATIQEEQGMSMNDSMDPVEPVEGIVNQEIKTTPERPLAVVDGGGTEVIVRAAETVDTTREEIKQQQLADKKTETVKQAKSVEQQLADDSINLVLAQGYEPSGGIEGVATPDSLNSQPEGGPQNDNIVGPTPEITAPEKPEELDVVTIPAGKLTVKKIVGDLGGKKSFLPRKYEGSKTDSHPKDVTRGSIIEEVKSKSTVVVTEEDSYELTDLDADVFEDIIEDGIESKQFIIDQPIEILEADINIDELTKLTEQKEEPDSFCEDALEPVLGFEYFSQKHKIVEDYLTNDESTETETTDPLPYEAILGDQDGTDLESVLLAITPKAKDKSRLVIEMAYRIVRLTIFFKVASRL